MPGLFFIFMLTNRHERLANGKIVLQALRSEPH